MSQLICGGKESANSAYFQRETMRFHLYVSTDLKTYMHVWIFIDYKVVDNDTLKANFYAAVKMDGFEEKETKLCKEAKRVVIFLCQTGTQ